MEKIQINKGLCFINISLKDIKNTLYKILREYNFKAKKINYILLNDEEIKEINVKYLQHDYYTDVIGFDNGNEGIIDADIFISFDRVKENALKYGVSETEELYRVMIHGLLHMVGENDKTNEERRQMKAAEEKYLKIVPRETRK